jgi:putative protease
MPLAAAGKQPLTTERLREQLGRLGGTAFELGTLDNHLEPGSILPVSELNRLRREWVSRLDALRVESKRWTLATLPARAEPPRTAPILSEPELIVLIRSQPQLEAALRSGGRTIYCELEDPKKYRLAVACFREWHQQARAGPGGSHLASAATPAPQEPASLSEPAIYVAPPRIFKMGEDWILKQVRSCEADGYLVRNYDHLKYFSDCRCVGDYSFNVANALSADYFKNHCGLERVTASYDLNAAQLEALLLAAPPAWFEITIHQHMPMFHMEHCVFCAFLSQGTDYTNCGRPCDQHQVQLEDRVGAKHPVKADAGCRNTVFNALAQTGAEHVSRFRQLGVKYFRIELLDEPPELVEQTISQYRRLLSGQVSGANLWRELRLHNQLGVTRGQLRKSDGRPNSR